MESTVFIQIVLFCGVAFLLLHTVSLTDTTCCIFGWVLYNNSCYRIINTLIKKKNANKTCLNDNNSTLATLSAGVLNRIGYSEELWVKCNASNEVCKWNTKMSSLTSQNKHKNIKLRPMCESNTTKTCEWLQHTEMRFDEGNWIIPNTNWSYNIMINSINESWIGLYWNKKKMYWGDKTEVSQREKSILFSNNVTINADIRCAFYQNNTIRFVQCGCQRKGLYKKYKSKRFVNTECKLTTTSSHLSSTKPTTTIPSTTVKKLCLCRCQKKTNEKREELEKIFPKKNETSRYKRSKTSAPDERKSSKVIAGVAVIVMAIPVILIVASDIISFVPSIRELIKSIRTKRPKNIQKQNIHNI